MPCNQEGRLWVVLTNKAVRGLLVFPPLPSVYERELRSSQNKELAESYTVTVVTETG